MGRNGDGWIHRRSDRTQRQWALGGSASAMVGATAVDGSAATMTGCRGRERGCGSGEQMHESGLRTSTLLACRFYHAPSSSTPIADNDDTIFAMM
jgi:hypothetical protein